MAYILGALHGPWEERERRFAAYRQYLQSIREQLPPAAFAFATADWHYNFADPRCPHDAWLETLTITEPATGARQERRRIDIHAHLLGAYHDGHIALAYRNVRSYTLAQPAPTAGPPFPETGHGDWRDDEIRLSPRGLVLHEVVFSGGGQWLIECEDVLYEWRPFTERHP
jgi:hypothetical protein